MSSVLHCIEIRFQFRVPNPPYIEQKIMMKKKFKKIHLPNFLNFFEYVTSNIFFGGYPSMNIEFIFEEREKLEYPFKIVFLLKLFCLKYRLNIIKDRVSNLKGLLLQCFPMKIFSIRNKTIHFQCFPMKIFPIQNKTLHFLLLWGPIKIFKRSPWKTWRNSPLISYPSSHHLLISCILETSCATHRSPCSTLD